MKSIISAGEDNHVDTVSTSVGKLSDSRDPIYFRHIFKLNHDVLSFLHNFTNFWKKKQEKSPSPFGMIRFLLSPFLHAPDSGYCVSSYLHIVVLT